MAEQKSYLIKLATKLGEENPRLDIERLRSNAANGIRTAVQLDANVLINILDHQKDRDGIPGYEKLVRWGLYDFVELIWLCNKESIPLSIHPGIALTEVQGDPNQVRKDYDDFLAAYQLELEDDPFSISWSNATPSKLPAHLDNCGFFKLTPDEQKFRACSFVSLLAMLIVDSDLNLETPISRIRRYLDLMLEFVGVFSVKETMIACLVLGDLVERAAAGGYSVGNDGEMFYAAVLRNFARRRQGRKPLGRRPRTSTEVFHLAFNSANDIAQVNAGIVMEDRGLDGGSKGSPTGRRRTAHGPYPLFNTEAFQYFRPASMRSLFGRFDAGGVFSRLHGVLPHRRQPQARRPNDREPCRCRR